jgi:1,5-anhydro-D-fructose reductase (1,5-anhydro-D-mannitol-forming)
MATRTVRWGMIGCGDVTEVKSGPGFQKATDSALVACMRRDAGAAQDYARRHGVPRWYSDAARLIADPEVDAVYIATPPASHRQYTLMAAEAGKPVYVEKPMATRHGECLEMVAACQRASVPLFVAYYRRALPRFLKVKELLEAGAIGEVRLVSTTLRTRPDNHPPGVLPWRVDPAIAGGGLFLDLGSHTLDLLDFFLGPISQVSGAAANQAGLYPAEDIVTAQLRFASGVLGVGSWCFTAGERLDRTEIIGSRGTIRFATFDDEPVVVTGETSQSFAIPHPPHIQQPLIQIVVDALNGTGRSPSTGASGARTSWVMDQVLAGYRSAAATEMASAPITKK